MELENTMRSFISQIQRVKCQVFTLKCKFQTKREKVLGGIHGNRRRMREMRNGIKSEVGDTEIKGVVEGNLQNYSVYLYEGTTVNLPLCALRNTNVNKITKKMF